MENDAKCKSIGIDSIKSKMFNGKIQTLTDVRYAGRSSRNLWISLRY